LSGLNRRVVIVASLALILGGCVGSLDVDKRMFAIERVPELQRGMTKDQIVAVLGPPHYMFKEDRPQTPELWTYVSEPSGPPSRQILRIFFDPAGQVAHLEMRRNKR
jgi:outer membrane protein assembly factor BamE (lipoprotein component of BamABCDE complex)